MGFGMGVVGFSAPAMYQSGFLKDGQVKTWTQGTSTPINLISIIGDLPGNGNADGYAGAKFDCPQCKSGSMIFAQVIEQQELPKGGTMWVSFRGDESVARIQERQGLEDFQGKVLVHYDRAEGNKVEGMGTELWAVLGEGQW